MSLENFLAKNNKFLSPMAMLLIFFMNKIKCLFSTATATRATRKGAQVYHLDSRGGIKFMGENQRLIKVSN